MSFLSPMEPHFHLVFTLQQFQVETSGFSTYLELSKKILLCKRTLVLFHNLLFLVGMYHEPTYLLKIF